MKSPALPLSRSPTLAPPVFIAVWLAIGVSIGSAAEVAPSWTALPEQTVLMLRVPGGEAFFDALRKQTKLGEVVLSEDRLARLADVIRDQSPESFESLREALGRLDLKPGDWKGLFHGDLGVALTLEQRDKPSPLVVLLGWLEPGEELAPRLVAAIQMALADHTDEPFAPRRKDIELAGHNVMHIEISVPGVEKLPQPEAEGAGGKRPEQTEQPAKEAKIIESDRMHLFVAQLGGRIVWGATVPQSSDEVEKQTEAERAAIDWDALTGLETAMATFGRFLTAHEGSAEGGARKMMETPGLEASLPSGAALFEILADPRPLLKLAQGAGDAKVGRVLEAVGANNLGPLALRTALDGTALRSGIFLSTPAPRSGLLMLLEQPSLAPEPPPWVPANAIGYQQMSFLFGNAYGRIKQFVADQSGDEGRKAFDQIESAAKLFLQVDLNDLLASLGEQHSVVTFTPRVGDAAPQPGSGEGAGKAPAVVQRLGIVSKVSDEQLWKQLLQVASRFGQGGAAGGLQAVEEQGFSGYRAQQGGNEFGIFVGHSYLVIGIGPEVSESLLSVLTSPPEGEAAMRGSGLVERGRALISPRPCLAYRVSDAGASLKTTRQTIHALLEAPLSMNLGGATPPTAAAGFQLPAATHEDRKQLVEKIKSLLPSDDELEGIFGVSISQTVITDDGLVVESALELPAP